MSYYRDKPGQGQGSFRGSGGRGGNGNNFNQQQQHTPNFGGRQPPRNPGYGYDSSPRNNNFNDRRNYPGPAFDQPSYGANNNSNGNNNYGYEQRERERGMEGPWDRDNRRPGPPHSNDSMRGNPNPASLLPTPPAGNNILALSLLSSLLQQQQGLPQLLDRPHGPPQNNRSPGMHFSPASGERRPMNRGFPDEQGPFAKMARMEEGFKTPSARGRNSERGRGRGRERSRSAATASPSTNLPNRFSGPPASQPRPTPPNSAPPAGNRRGQSSRGGRKKARGWKITYTPAPPNKNTTTSTTISTATAASTASPAPKAGDDAAAQTQAPAAAAQPQVQEPSPSGTDKTSSSGNPPATLPAHEQQATEGEITLESKPDAIRDESKDAEGEANGVEGSLAALTPEKDGEQGKKSPCSSVSSGSPRKKIDKDNTPYAGLSKELLYCHVCMKHMRDGISFTNHLGGRAHQLLMKKLEESYELRGNFIRHYVAMEEQRRNVELDRLYRLGKAQNVQQDFCAMCSLKFFGNVSVHRKTPLHQALKRFLHPTCNVCQKEFSNRIDRDFHKLTAEHLKAMTALEGKIVKDDEAEGVDFGALFEGLDASKLEEGLPADWPENGTVGEYNSEEAIGQSMIKRIDAFYCRVCRILLLNEAEVTGAHCGSKAHYDNYSAALNQAIEGKKEIPVVNLTEEKNETPVVEENPTAVSETAVSETAVSETAVSETAVSETAAPEVAAPAMETSEVGVSDVAAPDSSVETAKEPEKTTTETETPVVAEEKMEVDKPEESAPPAPLIVAS